MTRCPLSGIHRQPVGHKCLLEDTSSCSLLLHHCHTPKSTFKPLIFMSIYFYCILQFKHFPQAGNLRRSRNSLDIRYNLAVGDISDLLNSEKPLAQKANVTLPLCTTVYHCVRMAATEKSTKPSLCLQSSA